jgi:glutathione S-transferase
MSSKPMELFWIAGSPFSWRVMLTLEAKSIAYTPRLLQASQREHKQPDFLALNPRGKVPVLRDGDVVVYESIAIMQYLERRYPAPPMFGRTALQTAVIWRAISEFSSYLQEPLLRVAGPLLTGKAREMAGDVRAALPEVHAEVQRLERSLAVTGWLAGIDITAADATAYPFLKVLLRAAGKDDASQFEIGLLPLEDRYPRLATWMAEVERLPGYERTYPPHWRQQVTLKAVS